MSMHFVVVADTAHARVFAAGAEINQLTAVHALDHDGYRHRAADVCPIRRAGALWRSLPGFLGLLRPELSPQVTGAVVAEIGKNWTKVSVHELAGRSVVSCRPPRGCLADGQSEPVGDHTETPW